MQNSLPSISQIRADWLAKNPFKDFLPDWLNAPARAVTLPRDDDERTRLDQRRAELDAFLNVPVLKGKKYRLTYRQRVDVARKLSSKLREWDMPELGAAADKLLLCHACGYGGEDLDSGDLVVMYDSKCGNALLCPHCARAEGRRLVRRYKNRGRLFGEGRLVLVKRRTVQHTKFGPRPVNRSQWVEILEGRMAQQLRKKRWLHYGVLTWPNIKPGDLEEFMDAMPVYLKKLCDKFPQIKGAMLVEEAPLSAHDDWNLHGNVLFLVEGWLEFGEVREEWTRLTRHLFPGWEGTTFNTHFKPLPRDPAALDAALRELIKYPVKHISGGRAHEIRGADQVDEGDFQSPHEPRIIDTDDRDDGGWYDDRSGEDQGSAAGPVLHGLEGGLDRQDHDGPGEGGGSDFCDAIAPAMIDYHPSRFREWWSAHQQFRRTRSYGALFRVPKEEERAPRAFVLRWRFEWCARASAFVVYRTGYGPVNLIQGDKSGARKARSDNFLGSVPGGADPPRYQ